MLFTPSVRKEKNLAELAYGGLSRVTKGVYGPTDFDSIGNLLSKVSAYERLHPDLYAERPCRPVAYFDATEEESADEAEVAIVQWARASQPLSCSWLKQPEAKVRYDFDVTKTEQIFDLLLKEKQLQLTAGHQIPSASELKGRKYCKWHNTTDSHDTVDCKALR